MFRITLCLLVASLGIGQGFCEEISRADEDLFEIHVRPLLVNHCIRCHGEAKQEGGLRLTSLADLEEGGDSGAAIVAGEPGESLVIEAMRYESFEMPPDGQLEDEPVAGFAKWIAAGAPWPEGVVLEPTPLISAEDRQWWCYQPIATTSPPVVENDSWCRGEIDRFVLHRLLNDAIEPATEADPATLTRRVYFGLTGLPPDEAAIDAAQSGSFDYASLVDRLLEETAYGQNQAKYWLDLVRYAETDGYRADHARPEAYRYRDYVIAAFNNDKPYDRFIREQLAGDEIAPSDREAIVATMYLRHWIYEHNQRDVETQWHEILSDITETTADVFLAQGFKCARCHDHKFDPILQKDYFRMKAFFAAFEPAEAHPVADVATRREYQDKLSVWEDVTRDIRVRLHELENPVLLKHATREGFDKFIPKIKAMIRMRPEDRAPYEQQIASLASRQFDLPYDKLSQWLTEEEQAERKQLLEKLAKFDSIKPSPLPTMKFVASDVGPVAPTTYIPDDEEKNEIAPGFMTLLDAGDAKITPPPAALQSTGRRTALADWVASRDNPLTARVIVNRIWQQHFGVGLVDTSSDFGHLGAPPSHPLLLDWLAKRFMDDGWSIKKLHRLILTSATYRQTSRRPIDDRLRQLDPGNRLLWRMNPRRLSGEELTDAVLSVSGELKDKKRAIYGSVQRNKPDPLLAAFDSPDRIRSIGKRHRTTTSTQALLLANGDWLQQRASSIVKKFRRHRRVDPSFVTTIYRSLFGRTPEKEEIDLAIEFLAQYSDVTPNEKLSLAEKLVEMPKTGGKAIDMKPSGSIDVSVATSDALPDGDFTVEAFVLLRSLYPDANVRTIVTHWDGSKSNPGWSFGVTSTKSAYQPRNLILQLIGKTKDGDGLHYEVVASGLRPELNKPYYLAASVKLDDTTKQGITFYLRDLSDPKAKLQTAQADHRVIGGIRPPSELTIGARRGKHKWDGLIDNVRVEKRARNLAIVAQADSVEGLPEFASDWRFEDAQHVGFDSSGYQNHAVTKIDDSEVKTPLDRAHVALVHALLNSNEMIYVD